MERENDSPGSRDDERVRDHLANERTYLAWLRTGISTMGFGVVIAKLRYLFAAAGPIRASGGIVHASNIGLVLVVIGLITVVLSARHYVTVRRQIREGRFTASASLAVGLAVVIALLGVVIIWYLVESSRF
jgi:putative membrane protein